VSTQQKNWIFGVWFTIDGLLAMFPPVYWYLGGSATPSVFGLPLSVAYYVGVNLLITISIIAAFLVESARGELNE
jgi:hypothetical protein